MDDLKLDVLSGSPPDLMAYSESAYMYRYANLGAFADLYELMEKNDGLKKEDILDNVLQAYEYKGGLYGLPIAFNIDAFMANSDVIGREYTFWNYDEFFSFAENLPEGMYLGSKNSVFAYKDFIFETLCAGSLGSFIDYDNYTCNFDSEEFIHLLNFCNDVEINEPYDWEESDWNTEQQDAEYMEAATSVLRKTALLEQRIINDPVDCYGMTNGAGLFLNDNYTFLIVPSDDRRGTIFTSNNMCFSVLNNAACPDGAWDFMNYIFSAKFQENYLQVSSSLTSNKESMEYKFKKLQEDYADLKISLDPYSDETGPGTEEGVD